MKTCPKCQDPKEDDQFYQTKSRKNGASYCKECFNELCIKRWIQRKIDAINSKGGHCKDCNLKLEDTHYSVFEFHHLDPSEKEFGWTKLRLRSKESIKEELDKCVLLCANCHRIRHSNDALSS